MKTNIHLIETYIKENNLTKKSFCVQCGIGTHILQRIMQHKNVRLKNWIKICRATKIKLDDLIL